MIQDQQQVEKLVIAIVRNDDANKIVEELIKRQIGNTRINTAGGFFRRGNVTLLVGVPAGRVEEVLTVLRERVGNQPLEGQPEGVQYRGVAFVLDVPRYVRV